MKHKNSNNNLTCAQVPGNRQQDFGLLIVVVSQPETGISNILILQKDNQSDISTGDKGAFLARDMR